METVSEDRRFAILMAALSTAFNDDSLTREKIEIYRKYLSDIRITDLERGVHQIIKTRKYSSLPTIAEIREAAIGNNSDALELEAAAAWGELRRCYILGEKPSPMTAEATRLAFGGMTGYENSEDNDFTRKRFIDIYRAHRRQFGNALAELEANRDELKRLRGEMKALGEGEKER